MYRTLVESQRTPILHRLDVKKYGKVVWRPTPVHEYHNSLPVEVDSQKSDATDKSSPFFNI
jgi:hypothetical protein